MKNHAFPPTLRHISTTLLGALALSLTPAQAIVINFEATEGYTPTGGTGDTASNLKGQPGISASTPWNNISDGATLRITDDGSGNQWVQAYNNSENGYNGGGSPYLFTPTNDDLGSPFDGNASIVALSFTYVRVAAGSGVGSGQWLIGNDATRLEFYTDGLIYFYSTSSNGGYVKNASDGTFIANVGTAYQIDLILDYSTKTYTLRVDDIEQSVAGSATLGFRNTSSTAFDIAWYAINIDSPGWAPHAIDNISLQVIPEPSSLALLALATGAAGLCRLRGRRD